MTPRAIYMGDGNEFYMGDGNEFGSEPAGAHRQRILVSTSSPRPDKFIPTAINDSSKPP
jgi:hypothetical protein